tara:strand:- start:211 stop:504 length:294 start_codon:yes stop_codon:yes gene_type:complete
MSSKITNFQDVATQIGLNLLKGEGNNLPSVMLKGEKSVFHYSAIHKKPIQVPVKGEYYLLPLKEDSEGRLYVYSTYLFFSGLILRVPKDEIELIGYN